MSGENPLAEATVERVAPPAVLVVFGASGDLTSRKLMPAVENLALRRLLPPGFSVVGVARTEMDDDSFRERMRTAVEESGGGGEEAKHVWEAFAGGGFRYVAGDYSDPETFKKLKDVLDSIDEHRGTAQNRLIYLATPPDTFPVVVQGLARCGLNRPAND